MIKIIFDFIAGLIGKLAAPFFLFKAGEMKEENELLRRNQDSIIEANRIHNRVDTDGNYRKWLLSKIRR